jgi:hypothetical protein
MLPEAALLFFSEAALSDKNYRPGLCFRPAADKKRRQDGEHPNAGDKKKRGSCAPKRRPTYLDFL